jgi:methionyl aminopeptidase
MHITLKSKAEIARMRAAGRIVAEVLALVEESLRPGVSTAELDRLAERHIRAAKGVPSFLNYLGGRRYDARDPHAYPASTCISIDNEIVHGIPGDREVRAGQLVSVDVGVIYDEWHGDGARTFICGGPEAAPAAARGLVDATRLSLMAGIRAATPGNFIADISAAVEDVATPGGYGIVRQYVGHGIGTSMHEDPQVPNFRSRSKGIRLEPGLCLAIEPMLTLGSEATETLDDGWTVVTWDGSLAAHFEHTIAVTAEGPEILTTA